MFRFVSLFAALLLFWAPAKAELGARQKIYVRNWLVDEHHRERRGLIKKNTYDVIYELNRHQLYLVSERQKFSAFIQEYERLTVEVAQSFVEVTLSDKLVVRRYYRSTESPLLEVRLALYELFLGRREFLRREKSLREESLRRMELLEKVEARQQALAQREKPPRAEPEQLRIPNPARRVPAPPASAESPQASGTASAEESAQPEEETKATASFADVKPTPSAATPAPPPKTSATPSERVPVTATAVAAPAAEIVTAAAKPNPSDAAKKPSTSLSSPSKPSAKSSTAPPPASARAQKPRAASPAAGARGEREQGYTLLAGFWNFHAASDDIIKTSTNLSYVLLGARWFSRLKDPGSSEGFWNGLDYEAEVSVARAIETDNYEVGLAKNVRLTATQSFLDGFGLGASVSYETAHVGLLRDIGQGLAMMENQLLVAGPELRYRQALFRRSFAWALRYQQVVFQKNAPPVYEFSGNKLALSLSRAPRPDERLSYEARWEQLRLNSKGPVGTGTVNTQTLVALIHLSF